MLSRAPLRCGAAHGLLHPPDSIDTPAPMSFHAPGRGRKKAPTLRYRNPPPARLPLVGQPLTPAPAPDSTAPGSGRFPLVSHQPSDANPPPASLRSAGFSTQQDLTPAPAPVSSANSQGRWLPPVTTSQAGVGGRTHPPRPHSGLKRPRRPICSIRPQGLLRCFQPPAPRRPRPRHPQPPKPPADSWRRYHAQASPSIPVQGPLRG